MNIDLFDLVEHPENVR